MKFPGISRYIIDPLKLRWDEQDISFTYLDEDLLRKITFQSVKKKVIQHIANGWIFMFCFQEEE